MANKIKNSLFMVGIILYIGVGIACVNQVTSWITDEYYKTLSSKAEDVAKIASQSYTITDQEVLELKSMEFEDILQHPANQRLSKLFIDPNFSEDFRYAYIMVWLNKNEIKYIVDETNKNLYETEVGTPLDLLWLVDVIINSEEQMQVESIEDYYADQNRYSYMRPDDIKAYANKESSTVIISRDEYGDAFTGLVPIYTIEGNFVGMLGVDIYFEKFEKHVTNIRRALTLIFILPTIILTVAYLAIYLDKYVYNNKEANIDPLTSLYNRRYLNIQLPKLIKEHYRKQCPISIIMIDVDFFKKYNDHYGHQKGDEVLVKISKAITSVLRQNIDIVCRYGGEEIIVLLPTTNLSGATYVAEKIKNVIYALGLPHQCSEVSPFVSVSQGICCQIPQSQSKESESSFIDLADQALYEAKNRGRNNYIVYQDSETQL